ncbi:amidase [Arthrobacter sulfonylureivorans]|uniref:Amidase n=1 Tax=Arthrobacter sulfonylureivorans TaxID=2486855 RepID=A0ABY3WF66_9MICC|nr:amidase [Arthrobacter sulfonylureivorans]UNK47870.1 amidase [Arthrobacter sulfonylureivorans]
MTSAGVVGAGSAAALLEDFGSGAKSPIDVTAEILDRVQSVNPTLSAFLAVDSVGAKQAAVQADRAWRDFRRGRGPAPGPLCGVPVSVKDTIEVGGMPTTYGSLAFAEHLSEDSMIATRLREAGAIILGKTNTSEFALSSVTWNRLAPPTRNPWNLEASPGGSSGGAAAAVAAALGPIAIGTDSAGSIRFPAAVTGLVGLKPTRGAIPVIQRWRASPTRSHPGVITRTIADARLTFATLSGHRHQTDTGFGAPLVGVIGRDDDEAVDAAVGYLEQLGAKIIEAAPLPTSPLPESIGDGLWPFGAEHFAAANDLQPGFLDRNAKLLTSYALPLYKQGAKALAWEYRSVLNLSAEYARRLTAWAAPYDVVLTATRSTPVLLPASVDRLGLGPKSPELSPWNYSGHPAIVLPIGEVPGKPPSSVQIIGQPGDDHRLLNLAAALEAARQWLPAAPLLQTSGN